MTVRIAHSAIICLVLAVTPAMAQVSLATVAGVVEDTSGARLPSARITLTNLLNGSINAISSDAGGSFLLPGVLPGTYNLQVERAGFTPLQLIGLTLSVAEVRQFRVRLNVSGTQDAVNVVADVPPLNAQDAQISTAVDPRLVEGLPLNGRSFQDLVAMTPGAVLQSPQIPRAGGFSVNGQPVDTNTYLIDGISANYATGPLDNAIKVPAAGQFAPLTTLGTTQGLLALDALQEFRVVSSSASPEYGRGAGGQFSILSRQGTDNIHASAYASLRNGYFDAHDWFGQNTSYYHQQDIGGTLTAPLDLWRSAARSRSRTFLFGTYEDLHVQQRLPSLNLYIPGYALRVSAPAIVQNALLAFPNYGPSFENSPLEDGSIFVSQTAPASFLRAMDFRVDRTLRGRLHVFARYGNHPSGSDSQLLSSITTTRTNNWSISAGLDAQVTATMGNELRYGWAQSAASSITRNYIGIYDPAKSLQSDIGRSLGLNVPQESIRSEIFLRFSGLGQTSAFSDGARADFRQLQVRDALSLQRGSHLLRLGFDVRNLHSVLSPREYSVELSYLDPASITSNVASYAVFRHALPAAPFFHQYAFFAQDAWHAAPRLTLTYGGRWDIAPAPGAADGRQPVVLQSEPTDTSHLTVRAASSPLWATDWFNFGPRLGVAWQMREHGGHELVLHAGAGVLFDNAHRAAAEMYRGLGFVATNVVSHAALPLTPAFPAVPYNSGTAIANGLGYLLPNTLHSPWTLQWNVLAEQALGPHQTVSLSAVGAAGHDVLIPLRHTLVQANAPATGYVTFPSGLTNGYRSVQLRWQGSSGSHLTWMTSYVWAHSMDDNSVQPWSLATHGSADTDVRNNLQASFVWELPRAKGTSIARNAFKGWSVDGRFFARSGYPITPTGTLLLDPVTGERFNRNVDLDRTQSLYVHTPLAPGGRVLNGGPLLPAGAFHLPVSYADGSAPRNIARGFGAQQLSLSLQREIRLHSSLYLQLRGDVFNTSNSPDFGYIDPQLTDQLFGRAVLSLNQSYGQTSSLYQPGGPRSLQFDFRLHW